MAAEHKEYLRNIPSGNDGKVFCRVNGNILPVCIIQKIEPTIDVEVEEGNFLGERMSQHANRRIKGSFSMSYTMTPYFARMIKEWKDTGVYPDITIQYYNEINGVHGRQEFQLRGCILNKIGLGMLDSESKVAILHETDGTFDDWDPISEYK